MKIFLIIYEDMKSKPVKSEYSGNWALETMIIKTLTYYYGSKVAGRVEDLLRDRVK